MGCVILKVREPIYINLTLDMVQLEQPLLPIWRDEDVYNCGE